MKHLFCDKYALTMGQIFFHHGKHNVHATFHVICRNLPKNWNYLLVTGQGLFLQNLLSWGKESFNQNKLQDLISSGFREDFIHMIAKSSCELTVHALEEGDIAFKQEPIVRIEGPLWQCILVEAYLLNCLNYQSSITTNTFRIKKAGGDKPLMEFGLRHAPDIGGLAVSRAAYIGGAYATSNLEASLHYGIPSVGTCGHAFIMSYEKELDAFKASVESGFTTLLVDTYSSIEGVKNAIKACKSINKELSAIRLDSGDLCSLSEESRTLLDQAGYKNAKIIGTNGLNEDSLCDIQERGNKIDIWGVGLNISRSPSVDLVYKPGHIDNRDTIKISEHQSKTTIPGKLDLIRLKDKDGTKAFVQDFITCLDHNTTQEHIRPLKKLFEKGNLVEQSCAQESFDHINYLDKARERIKKSIASIKDLDNYPVSVDNSLLRKRDFMKSQINKK